MKCCLSCVKVNDLDLKHAVICFETSLIKQALDQTNGNKIAAAKLLRIPASTLNDKLNKYNLR